MADATTGYSIEVHEQGLDSGLSRQVADYLCAENTLEDAGAAAERAAHTVALARDESGALVAQLSAEPRYVEQLHNRFWVISLYVSPDHRHADLSRRMLLQVKQALQARFHRGEQPDVIGLFAVIQTRAYQGTRDLAVTESGGAFIGRNRRGDNMRVYYFDGAHIDGSAPDLVGPSPESWELGEGYRVELVRDQLDEELRARIADFLQQEGALKDPAQARQRADLSVALAYDSEDRIVGQGAAEARYFPQLLNRFWAFSTYVAAPARRSHVGRHLLLESKRLLEKDFLEGANPDVIGIYLRMQSPRLRDDRRPAISHYSRVMFIGRNRRGDNLRVCYFPGARIDRGLLDPDN